MIDGHMFTDSSRTGNSQLRKLLVTDPRPPPTSVSQEKVDCITVNCEPVKAAIDDLIQRLFDMLLMSLRKSIQGNQRQLDHLYLTDHIRRYKH